MSDEQKFLAIGQLYIERKEVEGEVELLTTNLLRHAEHLVKTAASIREFCDSPVRFSEAKVQWARFLEALAQCAPGPHQAEVEELPVKTARLQKLQSAMDKV